MSTSATSRKDDKKNDGDNNTTEIIPELFDSSKDSAMVEIKESASMSKSGMERSLTDTMKEDRIHPEEVSTPRPIPEGDPNYPSVNPTLDERAEMVKESKRALKENKVSEKEI